MRAKQELLTQLYCLKLAQANVSPELAQRLSCPLLMSVLPDWDTADRRILIVGQETLAYDLKGDEAAGVVDHDIKSFDELVALPNLARAIDALMRIYANSMSWPTPANEFRPFWKAFAELNQLPASSLAWTNLFWCSLDGGSVWKKSTWSECDQIYLMQRGRLKQEIEVLNPTAAVFFTGPDYDPALKDEFPDVEFLEVGQFPQREFAQVVSNALPTKSYRLFHPKHLQMTRRWQWLEMLKQLIA